MDRHAAGRSARIWWVECHGAGIVKRLCQYAAPRIRTLRIVDAHPANLIGLEELKVCDVIDDAAGANRRDAAGQRYVQVVRLLLVGGISAGDVAHDDRGEIMLPQPRLKSS